MKDRRIASSINTRCSKSAERDYVIAAIANFMVGAMLGACITLGWMAL